MPKQATSQTHRQYPRNYGLEGPVQPNLAHRHVEYILFSLLDLPYPDANPAYSPKPGHANATISFNSLDQVIVTCPNGISYNLSCALKNANLNIFYLHADRHKAILDAIGGSDLSELSAENPSESRPIYRAEKKAADGYLDQAYYNINKLMRGEKPSIFAGFDTKSEEERKNEIKKILFQAILTTSFANKHTFSNRNASNHNFEPTEYFRKVGNLSAGLTANLLTGGRAFRMNGLNSFADSEGKYNGKSELKLRLVTSPTTMTHNFQYQHEREHLRPPEVYWRHNSGYETDEYTDNMPVIDILELYGLAAEETEHYLSEIALSESYDKYLNRPYPGGLSRHNHDLGHHARKMSYIEPIIDYLSHHAINPELKSYCENISHYDLEILKVIMAFSRAGRKSENSYAENPFEYMESQRDSAMYTADFLKNVLGLSAEEVEFYREVQEHLGNPNYAEVVTGTDEEKKHKLYLHQIASFSHSLDLCRCIDEESYMEILSNYRQSGEDNFSIDEETAFKQLIHLAQASLKHTKNATDVFTCLDTLDLIRNTILTNPNNKALLENFSVFKKISDISEKAIQTIDEIYQYQKELEKNLMVIKFKDANQNLRNIEKDTLLIDPNIKLRTADDDSYSAILMITTHVNFGNGTSEIIIELENPEQYGILWEDCFDENGEILGSIDVNPETFLTKNLETQILYLMGQQRSEMGAYEKIKNKYYQSGLILDYLNANFGKWISSPMSFIEYLSFLSFDIKLMPKFIAATYENLSNLIPSFKELTDVYCSIIPEASDYYTSSNERDEIFINILEKLIKDKTIFTILTENLNCNSPSFRHTHQFHLLSYLLKHIEHLNANCDEKISMILAISNKNIDNLGTINDYLKIINTIIKNAAQPPELSEENEAAIKHMFDCCKNKGNNSSFFQRRAPHMEFPEIFTYLSRSTTDVALEDSGSDQSDDMSFSHNKN